jgi:hypothetical protein
MGETAAILLASILLKDMRYLVSINQSINQTLFTHGTISQRQKLKYLQDVIFQ